MYDKTGNLVDRRELLRIKVNSLAVEARIIRAAEEHLRKKARGLTKITNPLRESMHHHRTVYLRDIARHAHLALGLIKGRTLEQMEPKRRPETKAPDLARIKVMVDKYGSSEARSKLVEKKTVLGVKVVEAIEVVA